MQKLIPTALLLSLICAGQAQAELGTPAGVAGAVTGQVGLTSPAKQITAPVAVSSGDGIVMGDNLETGAASRLQVMLLDESAITLGPEAQLVIDEFVFDPANTDASTLAASLLKGTFRLVTGSIARQNPDGTSLNLPNAVLTIRGTTVMGACAATCVVALAGSGDANTAGKKPSTVTLKSAKGEVTLKRPGYYVEIGSDGTMGEPMQLNDMIEQRFAGLFPASDAPGAVQQASVVSGARNLIEASGQPAQEGRALALDQREFAIADHLDGGDLFDTTSNLPVQQINYQSAAISFSGPSQDGDIYFNYSLNLAARDFSGSVLIDHTDLGFQNTFPLLVSPFANGNTINEHGFVLDPTFANDTFDITYTINQQNVLISNFEYDQDGVGATLPSTGSGTAPAIP